MRFAEGGHFLLALAQGGHLRVASPFYYAVGRGRPPRLRVYRRIPAHYQPRKYNEEKKRTHIYYVFDTLNPCSTVSHVVASQQYCRAAGSPGSGFLTVK